jgi:SAM-dependent methyltransferase
MAVTPEIENDQRARWNGPGGRAWVDAQDVLDQVLKPLEELLVGAIPTGFDGAVLDVGCGTGGTTVAAARRLSAKGHAVGIDISEPMIGAARARADRERAVARFICADAQAHAFEAAAYDAIISRLGVMFFAEPVAAFANLRRAARRGGTLRFIAWRSASDNPFMTTAERAAAPLLPNLPPRRDGPGQFAFADRGEVLAILQDSGWSRIDVQPIGIACTMPEQALVPYLRRVGPVALALQDADDETRARVMDTVRVAFDPYVHGDEVRFTAACWIATAGN